MIDKIERCEMLRDQLQSLKNNVARFKSVLNRATNINILAEAKALKPLIRELVETISVGIGETVEKIRQRLKPSYLALDEFMVNIGYDNGAANAEVDTDRKKVVIKGELRIKGNKKGVIYGTLPKDILIEGDLKIEDFLLTMSGGLVVYGDLVIRESDKYRIVNFPDDIRVDGDAYVPERFLKSALDAKSRGQIKGFVNTIN